jgi:UDP-glucose 4-epimerase
MKKPKAVILGGCGFIGSHLARALVAEDYSVRIFDKLYASHELIQDIEPSVEVIEGDVERPQDVLNALSGAEICFHLIHTTVPGSSMEDPGFDVQSNVVSSVRWMAQMDRTSVKRLIYISSGGTVYGIPQSNPVNEGHPTNPTSSYGISKLCIEKYALLYGQLYGILTLILRPSNVYGEGQRLNIGQGLIGVYLNRLLHGEPIEVWGDGTVRRDYLYVRDLIGGILGLIEYQGPYGVFNISTGVGHSVLEIIEIIEEVIHEKPRIIFKPYRGFDVPINVLSSERLRTQTGWVPQTTLRQGIPRVFAWLQRGGESEKFK